MSNFSSGVNGPPERCEARIVSCRFCNASERSFYDGPMRSRDQVSRLRELSLTDTRVTQTGVNRIKSAMPQLAVRWWRECDLGE